MDLNLDHLKQEILEYLAAEEFAVFHSHPGGLEGHSMIFWDSAGHPDYRSFLQVAKSAGARIIVFAHRELRAVEIDDAAEGLDECGFPREEQRAMERSLNELRRHAGSTCSLELAFELPANMYVYEIVTDWYQSYLDILDTIEAASSEVEEEDDDDNSLGGYFSKN